ncbi:MAG: hypothetical protein KIS76_19400 [Pyrinomonadaceae bacterium]|nr:hypothetical protein [Pyrinomonadaceae bacterium]
MFNKLLLFAIISTFAVGAFGQTVKFDDRSNPVSTVSSYFNAVNNRDFERAYGYLQSPDESLARFKENHKDTGEIRLIVEPPTLIEGAAGSVYTNVPAAMIESGNSGKSKLSVGCFTMRRSNIDAPLKESNWFIYRAAIKPVTAKAELTKLLAESCEGVSNSPKDDAKRKGARVPGVISFGTEDLSGIIQSPASVKVNEEFEINVISSGDGCVSADGADVIQGENTADVFVYDVTVANKPDIACTKIFKQLSHKATLKFSKTGEAVIRVWGREQGGDDPLGRPVIITKKITVN